MKNQTFLSAFVISFLLVSLFSCSPKNPVEDNANNLEQSVDTNSNIIENEVLSKALFSCNENGHKICFASGNLQTNGYQYRLARNQYTYIGQKITDSDGWRDWFRKPDIENLSYNGMRLLTRQEWFYILKNSKESKWISIAGIGGWLLTPNDWEAPLSYDNHITTYNLEEWQNMEKSGAVFLPSMGKYTQFVNILGLYHTQHESLYADYYYFYFNETKRGIEKYTFDNIDASVRLVKDMN